MKNDSNETKRKDGDHLDKRDNKGTKSHHQPRESHHIEKRHTHIQDIGNDCIGQIFTFLTLSELGSVIARASKQWQHIVEAGMPMRDDVCTPIPDDENLNALLTGIEQVQSRIGRRHIGTVLFRSTFRSCILSEMLTLKMCSTLSVSSNLHTFCLRTNSANSGGFGKIFTALHHHSTLTHIDVSHNRFNEDDAKMFRQLIHHNRIVTTLKADYCQISSIGMVNILSPLQRNTTLRTLSLNGSFFDSTVSNALIQVLSINTSLTELELGYCSIQLNGLKILWQSISDNRALKSLRLRSNQFGPESGLLLGEVIRHNSALTYLDISGNCIRANGMQIILNAVSSNSTIEALDIGRNRFGSECTSALVNMLTRNSTLTELELGRNIEQMDWKSLFAGLRQNRSITKIDFSHNEMTADNIRSLVSLVTDSDHPSPIRSIDLSNNLLKGDAVYLLAAMLSHRNCELTSLMLSYTGMTSTGVETILSALHHNTSLTTIDVSGNNLESDDHLVGQLLALAKSNSRITVLHFDRYTMGT